MSVQSAAVVHILCIDDVIVGFSRHGSVGSRPYYIYFPYKGVLNFVKQGRIYSQEFALGDKIGV